MSDALWKLQNVSLGDTRKPRLADVTLEIFPGVTAVMGQSGAGKTSLLNLLVGFEKPERGNVFPILPFSHSPIPLFWVPQDDGLWPHLRAREHLEMVGGGKTSNAQRGVSVTELLGEFDLAEKAESYPSELSQGEQSRLSVARALASGAAVLVMDEPLVHVDVTRVGKYWAAIRRRVEANGMSLIFSTHSPQTVLGEAQRVICVRDGRVLYAGEVEELYWKPVTRELAECLGEANWLTKEEETLWLENVQHSTSSAQRSTLNEKARCLRPEQIAVERVEQSAIVVESSKFQGAVAEALLRHEASGATRTFFHRPSANHLRKGDRVVLKLALLLMVLFSMAGCDGKKSSTLAFKEVRHWASPPDGARIPSPRSVAVGRNGETVALDTAGRVLVFNEKGEIVRHWKMPEITVGKPEGVRVLGDGRIIVCDTHYHRVMVFDENGGVLQTFGEYGTGTGQFIYPVGITTDAQENLYIAEYGGNDRVQKFTRDGKFLATFGGFGTGVGELNRASGLLWHDGKVYVADAINSRIQVFTDDGKFIGTLGADGKPLPLNLPYDLTLGSDGALYIIEYGAGRISKASLAGELLGRFGSAGAGAEQFSTPWGITVDAKMRFRVGDTGNRRIVELKP